jgi:hypothetical protein
MEYSKDIFVHPISSKQQTHSTDPKNIQKFMWQAWGTKSIIDYIIINDKLGSNTEDPRGFRCSRTDCDHKLLESKFKFTINPKIVTTQERKKIQDLK